MSPSCSFRATVDHRDGEAHDSVFVDDEGPDQSAELDQRVPVTAVPCQSRRLDREHCAHAGFADRSQQALEAGPSGAAARTAKIIVDDLDSVQPS